VLPADGRYVLEVRDALYRGREDFVYRVTVGQVPFVTSIFPLGGRDTDRTPVAVAGWNLPVDRLVVGPASASRGSQPVCVGTSVPVSNSMPFAFDTLPECAEHKPDNSPARAQRVTLPVVVNGRIDRPGDVGVFRFEGEAGQVVVAETIARCLGSPLDSVLTLTDAHGALIAINDDFEDRGAGLITHQADSRLMVTLPARGAYTLAVRDAQHNGGPEYAYRLRISGPRPDFELRVVPSSLNARAGGAVPVTITALRRDGFSGEIKLSLVGAPPGFALRGGRVAAGKDEAKLTLIVPRLASDAPFELHVEGRAIVQGKTVRHDAVPADDMMQAFAYHHLVPAQALLAEVLPRPAFRRVPKSVAVGTAQPTAAAATKPPVIAHP
jgi:hypothetical protein